MPFALKTCLQDNVATLHYIHERVYGSSSILYANFHACQQIVPCWLCQEPRERRRNIRQRTYPRIVGGSELASTWSPIAPTPSDIISLIVIMNNFPTNYRGFGAVIQVQTNAYRYVLPAQFTQSLRCDWALYSVSPVEVVTNFKSSSGQHSRNTSAQTSSTSVPISVSKMTGMGLVDIGDVSAWSSRGLTTNAFR